MNRRFPWGDRDSSDVRGVGEGRGGRCVRLPVYPVSQGVSPGFRGNMEVIFRG